LLELPAQVDWVHPGCDREYYRIRIGAQSAGAADVTSNAPAFMRGWPPALENSPPTWDRSDA
jgi:hypothetical protein